MAKDILSNTRNLLNYSDNRTTIYKLVVGYVKLSVNESDDDSSQNVMIIIAKC